MILFSEYDISLRVLLGLVLITQDMHIKRYCLVLHRNPRYRFVSVPNFWCFFS